MCEYSKHELMLPAARHQAILRHTLAGLVAIGCFGFSMPANATIKLTDNTTYGADNMPTDTININSHNLILTGGTVTGAIVDRADGGSVVINGDVETAAPICGLLQINPEQQLTVSPNSEFGTGDIVIDGTFDIGSNHVTMANTTINGTLAMTLNGISTKTQNDIQGVIINTDNPTGIGPFIELSGGGITMGSDSVLHLDITDGVLGDGETSDWLHLIYVDSEHSIDGEFSQLTVNHHYQVTSKYNETNATTDRGWYKIGYISNVGDLVTIANGNGANIATANAWDSVAPGLLSARAEQLRGQLSYMSGPEYVDLLTEVAPTTSVRDVYATMITNNMVAGEIATRHLAQGRSGGDVFNNFGLWAGGTFNQAKQDTKDGFIGRAFGLTLGADTAVTTHWSAGVGYGLNRAYIDTDGGDTDVNSNVVFVYGKYQPSQWYIRGISNYGFAFYDESNDIKSAAYKVKNFGLFVAGGYDLEYGFTPEVGLRHTHINSYKYTDTLDQRIDVDSNDVVTLSGDMRYAHDFITVSGNRISPTAHLGLGCDLVSDKGAANVTIGGTGIMYRIHSTALNRFSGTIGFGLELGMNNWVFGLSYDLEARPHYTSQTGMIKTRYTF